MEPKSSLNGTILEMGEEHAAAVARIHEKELAGDFLPSLGANFLKTLYDGMLKSEQCIGFVYAIDEQAVGFVVAAKDTKKLFRDTFRRKGFALVTTALKKVIQRPSTIPKIIKTILYPKDKKTTAELLVIAIDDAYKNRGIGSELVTALNSEFMKESLLEYTVLVYKNNEKANKFYQAIGFHFYRSSELYGQECNIYKYRISERGIPKVKPA